MTRTWTTARPAELDAAARRRRAPQPACPPDRARARKTPTAVHGRWFDAARSASRTAASAALPVASSTTAAADSASSRRASNRAPSAAAKASGSSPSSSLRHIESRRRQTPPRRPVPSHRRALRIELQPDLAGTVDAVVRGVDPHDLLAQALVADLAPDGVIARGDRPPNVWLVSVREALLHTTDASAWRACPSQ
jgi:hypothetical protein